MNAKAKAITLSTATVDAIGAWSGQSIKTANSMIKAVDSLHADGVTAAMLKAPDKGESSVLFKSVKVSIVLGFTAAVQTLLVKDTKTLTDAKKEDKRYWQQQIGSKMKDLRAALARREKQGEESAGAGAAKSSWESVKRKVIAEIITQAQGKEASKINDMAKFIKDLQSALARIPADA